MKLRIYIPVPSLMVLRRIFRPQREEVAGDWRRLHNEELHNLYASPNVSVSRSRRMRWVGHVARIGDLGVNGKIILEWLLWNHCVQNGSGAHPASYTMGTRGSFPSAEVKE
jgi:hypothetical protein